MKRKERMGIRELGKKRIAAGLLAGAFALCAAGFGMVSASPFAAQAASSGGTDVGGATVYVDAENGLDTNEGTLEAPVQTLKRAQELARGLTQDMKGDVTVCLRGGRYTLEDTLYFDAQDSGQNGFNVVWTSYEGEEAEISGGTEITGWTLYDAGKGIWSAPAQGVRGRDFFVDGERAVRAKTESVKAVDVNRVKGEIMLEPAGLPESFARPQDMEIKAKAAWRSYIIHVSGVSEYKGYVVIQCSKESWDWTGGRVAPELKDVQFLENAYELLDQPGEWYLNSEEDRIYYMPKEGQDMDSADAVLGRLEELIRFEGTPEAVVENITLKNLAFRYTTWLEADKPRGVYMDGQPLVVPNESGSGIKHSLEASLSAVYGNYLHYMTVEGCSFEHLGCKGMTFWHGIKNARIVGNHIEDLGGSALYLGDIRYADYYPTSEAQEGVLRLTENNDITDNYIKEVCRTYTGMHGIYVGHVARTRIDHNTMIDLPYVGIGMGYIAIGEEALTADASKIECRENSISYNYLENTMSVMYDGGAIYMTPRYDDSKVIGNYINKSGNNGIYFDMHSYGFTVTGNVLLDCDRNYQWDGNHLYIYDNYGKKAPVSDLITERPIDGVLDVVFENNDLWDEAEIEAIRLAAGVRQPGAPGASEPSGEAKDPAGEPEAEGSESSGEEQPGEAQGSVDEPSGEEQSAEKTQEPSGEAQDTEADADASRQEDNAKVPAAVWILLPLLALAGGGAAYAIAKKGKRKG